MIRMLLVALLLACATPELPRWPTNNITYSIDPLNLKGLTPAQTEKTVHKAFMIWESTGAITLEYVTYGHIHVRAKDLEGTLGGFGYPPPDGRIQLDSSDRIWTESLLLRIALHEIGHALGLDHILNRNSVMWPIILNNHKLCKWDKEAIKDLYE